MPAHLRIAASQFPVSGDMMRNRRYIETQMKEAAAKGAHVIHFPETALPGYGPTHIPSLEHYDWERLEAATQAICDLASSLNLWVIMGSMRPSDEVLPRNCLQVIAPTGEVAGTYDKQRLYHTEEGYYSPGQTPLVMNLSGFSCGFLICYDNVYPELYEVYRKQGVGLLFHSFHNAGNRGATSIKELVRAILMVRAADHQMWISASNSSTRYSPLSACITRPDGTMVSTQRHVSSIIVEDYPLVELGWTYDNSA
jgi:predicted amidohydrolase